MTPERPRKLSSFILTRFPVELEYPGVYSARRFIQELSHASLLSGASLTRLHPPSALIFSLGFHRVKSE